MFSKVYGDSPMLPNVCNIINTRVFYVCIHVVYVCAHVCSGVLAMYMGGRLAFVVCLI